MTLRRRSSQRAQALLGMPSYRAGSATEAVLVAHLAGYDVACGDDALVAKSEDKGFSLVSTRLDAECLVSVQYELTIGCDGMVEVGRSEATGECLTP
jgi:hypothetical protein